MVSTFWPCVGSGEVMQEFHSFWWQMTFCTKSYGCWVSKAKCVLNVMHSGLNSRDVIIQKKSWRSNIQKLNCHTTGDFVKLMYVIKLVFWPIVDTATSLISLTYREFLASWYNLHQTLPSWHFYFFFHLQKATRINYILVKKPFWHCNYAGQMTSGPNGIKKAGVTNVDYAHTNTFTYCTELYLNVGQCAAH